VVLVSVLETHLSELMLSEHEIRNVKAQLATLTTQLGGSQVDPVVVRQAGRTLRSIIEGAMAILLSRAAQPTVWRWINKMLAKL